MFIANEWKDYEVIDCSAGEKLERWGDYLLVQSGSAGDLGYQEGAQRLEKDERPLSQKRKRWWGVGVL